MTIIELCGLPGAGKSTLISNYIAKYGNKKILLRKDLYPGNRILCNIQVRGKLLAYRFFEKEIIKNTVFEELFAAFPTATIHSKMRIVDLYNRISRADGDNDLLLLEEGPVQYLSALSQNEDITNRDAVVQYWKMFSRFGYHTIFCDCKNSTSISRMKERNKRNGSFDPDSREIEKELNRKRYNIQQIIGFVGTDNRTINMENPIGYNVDLLNVCIQEMLSFKPEKNE